VFFVLLIEQRRSGQSSTERYGISTINCHGAPKSRENKHGLGVKVKKKLVGIFLFPEVDYIQELITDITRKVSYFVLGGRLHVIFLFSEVASRDVFVRGEQGFSLPRR
jgi:hypothetical protein